MLSISKSGLLDTIQDAGRTGHAAWGINYNGVMDNYAMKVANALTGNDSNEPVIELHFPAATIVFHQAALIALSGADFEATVGDVPIPINKAVIIPQGAVVCFHKRVNGLRCYLSLHGGFAVKQWLGSSATNLAAGIGGMEGRKLLKGDEIHFRKPGLFNTDTVRVLQWRADSTSAYMDAHYLYFVKGPEWEWMDEDSQHNFVQEPFTISARSDRMAIRLQGEPLNCSCREQMVSSAVSMGTMQLMPGGEVVVLMADHQTTGGYPRIGNIISAHLPKLAQAGPGDYVHMLQVEQGTAEQLLFSQAEELKVLQLGCQFKLETVLKTMITH